MEQNSGEPQWSGHEVDVMSRNVTVCQTFTAYSAKKCVFVFILFLEARSLLASYSIIANGCVIP